MLGEVEKTISRSRSGRRVDLGAVVAWPTPTLGKRNGYRRNDIFRSRRDSMGGSIFSRDLFFPVISLL